jgi:hypothetical protein
LSIDGVDNIAEVFDDNARIVVSGNLRHGAKRGGKHIPIDALRQTATGPLGCIELRSVVFEEHRVPTGPRKMGQRPFDFDESDTSSRRIV